MKTFKQMFTALFITVLSFSAPFLKEETASKPTITHILSDNIRYEYVTIDGVTWVYVYENDILIAIYEEEYDN